MEVMIGLEVHCQLATRSKLFCSDSTDSRESAPNENTCPICLGFPGSKPVVNRKAIDYGIMVATALNSNIARRMYFSRKSYFYPDMAKNFQVTQYEIPLALGGYVEVGDLKVRIRRVHMEEDPAKLSYVGGDITNSKYVLIDYNRAGAPLLEIVTEPDFKTPQQARAFLEKLSSMLEHIGIYDPSREASLRVDSNVSIEGGNRVEVKNITGFANVEKALGYEIVRQRGLLRMNMKAVMETRHFDAATRTTKSLRKKEAEADYGYIFDPDLPSITLSEASIKKVADAMPELPDQRVARISGSYGLDEYQAKVLVYTDKNLADFFEECCTRYAYKDPPHAANWIINYLLKSLNWNMTAIKGSKVRAGTFIEFLGLIDSGTITERYAKELIKEYVDTGISPTELAERNIRSTPKINLEEIVSAIISSNRQAVEEFKGGNARALQFMIGQVLAKTNKQADPNAIKELILKMISEAK
ncbi:MAG: Asp-tRNA(Asn)/Glu-tRNA(Gln) amidotransferase subunit GatB [Candidatus Marsarchaeota archaeon]|jgi:aspartyl-tRNA(Asn)/glutamyl-tRNA(Gln) amidotransferase subunit B|nr:Asp-tRNA(Asn)/Glu-tRNA(Gln) amidotransferase subunit GatB [Candidatus Marsarchaeota archaeon]